MFLHGFGADLNGWRPVHRLLPETWPALAIDLPGHGLSPLGEDASFEALVGAARGALVGEGVGAAHLVGHSPGGAVAVALSRGANVKALSMMLIAPAGLGEETDAAFFEGFLQADNEAALTPWLNMLVVDPAALGFRADQDHAASASRAAAGRGAAAARRRPFSRAADRRSTSATFSQRLRRRQRSWSGSRIASRPPITQRA